MRPAKFILAVAVAASSCALLGGCQQADGPQQGSYTAARHRALGTNIPQPDSAATASNTYAPPGETGALNVMTPSRNSSGSR